MTRRWWLRVMVAVLALALVAVGCQPKAAPTVAPAPTAAAPVGPKAPPTAAPTAAPTTAPTRVATAAPTAPAPAEPCTVSERGILPVGPAPVPAVRASDWTLGPADALITITEYADVQCPPCSSVAPVLRQLQANYPKDVRLIFRHFPLDSIHPLARLAGQATEAAGAQGKFWEMLELLYAHQREWSAKAEADFKTYAAEQAVGLGLDRARFGADLVGEKAVAAVAGGLKEAMDLGLRGTPSLAINGFPYGGNWDPWTLSAIVELIKLDQRHYTSCPPTVIDPAKSYRATLKTTKGEIVIEMLPKQAPLAVNSFVFLAREGWYDNVPFHRVIPDFVAQAGDPTGTGGGGPGYSFRDEVSPSDQFDAAGLVAMANSGANTNGSQFFITYGPQVALNAKHTIFGRVTAGMEVAKQLTARDPSNDPNNMPEADRIVGVTVAEQ
ncbi:MAG: peptidylprolyl isomerase [Chloroflexota bacterium]